MPHGTILAVMLLGGQTSNTGQFQIKDYSADDPRDLFFYDQQSDKVGHLRLEGTATGTPIVTLGKSTTVTGRVVDENGGIVSGLSVVGEGVTFDLHQSHITGVDGRFSLRGFVPGRKYQLIRQSGGRNDTKRGHLATVQILDSSVQDLGDITWKPVEY